MTRTVVISGLGGVSPRAVGRVALWALLLKAEAGPAGETQTAQGVPVERIPDEVLEKRAAQLRHMDRLGRLATAATDLALEDSGLVLASLDRSSHGIVFGSGYGCLPTNAEYLESILERGARYGNPVVFQNTVTNATTGYISMLHGIRGPTATLCSGWTAGLEALCFGHQQIVEGMAERMIVASADTLSAQLLEGVAGQGWLSPSGRARPLDEARDGMCVSEGACTLVLEDLAQLRARGGHAYAEVAGTGYRSGPPGAAARTLARAVTQALHAARVEPEQLGAVFSSANGRRDFDSWESRGLREVLGAHAAKVPVTCSKAMLGESFSAAGPLATLLAALALDTGQVPATGGGIRLDPECGGLNLAAGAPFRLESEWVLVTSLGDEGSAGATVLRRARP
jgi:3-oxoacyl-(acyl-carrier-protein) synthase